MMERTWWESFRAEHGLLTGNVKALICEGNLRRIVVRHREGWDVEEFRLPAGGPRKALADLTAVVTRLGDCTIRIERVDTEAIRVGLMQTTAP